MNWTTDCEHGRIIATAISSRDGNALRIDESEEHGGVKARPRGCGPAARGAAHGGPCRDQVSYAYDLLLRQKVAKDLEHGDEAATASFTALSWDILRAAKVRSASGGGRAGNAHRAARRRRVRQSDNQAAFAKGGGKKGGNDQRDQARARA